MNNLKEVKLQQRLNDQSAFFRNFIIRFFSMLIGQKLLRSGLKGFKPFPLLSGGTLLYLGFTGDFPLVSWMQRKNINHGQFNFKKELQIQRSRQHVYPFFRDFTNILGQVPFVDHIMALDADRTHWEISLNAFGKSCVFEIFIVKERVGEFIGWSTGDNSVFYHSGKMEFLSGPTPDSTIINLVYSYTPPLGKVGRLIALPLNKFIDARITKFLMKLIMTVQRTDLNKTIT